jgi:hypothetical protein
MRTIRPVFTAAAAVVLAVGAATALPAVVAAPAIAAERSDGPPSADPGGVTTDFTAAVRSIAHGPGIVTLHGTVERGTSVEVAGDVLEPVWTEGGEDGHWEAQVRVRPGEHVIRVTSAVSGAVLQVPVDVLILLPPDMLATVDGIDRTITLDGSGHPEAHFVIRESGVTLAETDVLADGSWHAELRDLRFGAHHIEAYQYFDGTLNGGVDDVYQVSGAAVVETAAASRETDRIALAGRAPVGSTLTFEDSGGPVLDPDGVPVTVHVEGGTAWQAALPIPAGVRFDRITVITTDGDDELGRTETRVTIPIALTGSVEELPDGRVRLHGAGEPGGTVTLEDPTGTALTDATGRPIRTDIGRTWELVVPRAELPAGTVIARQRIQDVEQGALRLVLPALPERPGPGNGAGSGGSGPGSGGNGSGAAPEGGVAIGTVAPRPAAARLRGDAGSSAADRLAFTGAELVRPTVVAGVLLLLGAVALPVAGVLRRRAGLRR